MTPVLFTLTPGARHGARPVQHGHAPALDRDSRPLRGRGARRRADARATHACRAPERGWPLRHAATYGDSGGPPCRRCLSLFCRVVIDSTPTATQQLVTIWYYKKPERNENRACFCALRHCSQLFAVVLLTRLAGYARSRTSHPCFRKWTKVT